MKDPREESRISRRKFLAGGLAVTGVAFLSACSPASQPSPTAAPASSKPAASPAANGQPAAGGQAAAPAKTLKKVTIALGADARSMAPNHIVDWTTDIQNAAVYDRACSYDPAKGYKVGNWTTELKLIDDLTWEMKIVKPDIKFTNGEPLDAEAIKAGFEFAMDPATKSHFAERYKPIVGFEVVNPTTLRVKTSEPWAAMPVRMCLFYPIPPKYYKEKGLDHFIKNPVGSGPFIMKQWARDERMVLDRNPNYWRNPVAVEQMEFRYIPEFSARLSGLLAGEVDIVKDIPVDAIERVNGSGKARCEEIPSSRINYVALVNNRPDSVFKDKKVRQAMNYAVNVPEIIQGVFKGHATRMPGCLSLDNPEVNKNVKPYAYDPEKAKALLKEAGVDPTSLNITMDAPQGRYPMDKEAAQAVAAQLGKIGVKVQVRYNEWGTHLDKIVNRKTGDMFFLGWGPNMDAANTIEYLFAEKSTYSSYGDPKVEAKIATVSKTIDPTKRQALYDEIQQDILEESPWIFLWQQHDIYGVSNGVDWKPRPDEFLWMGEAKPK